MFRESASVYITVFFVVVFYYPWTANEFLVLVLIVVYELDRLTKL
jgi:hypothetical protein